MAMQITIGKLSEKNISFVDNSTQVNMTDFLKRLCNGYIREEQVLEDEEEIIVNVISLDNVSSLSQCIEKEFIKLIDKIGKTYGDEAKNELLLNMKDLVIFQSLIISMLMLPEAQSYALIIS